MKGNLEIHSENILPIIKKWLYSERDIFVRELTSNASDACEKLRLLNIAGPFSIDIRSDSKNGILEFEDNGIGMSADEVKKYIAQIAFSGAKEFAQHYKEGDQLIGHFGLGFYSAYMVAKTVEIETLSYNEGQEPVFWRCDGSIDYEIETGTRSKRGTLIRLILADDAKEYLEGSKLKTVLKKYCQFFQIPITFNGERINEKEPLWIKNPKECSKDEYLEFYRHLYPMEEDPLFWIHLNVDYPFHLKGILYFPKIKEHDWQKLSVQLFCNKVFVADHCKDVLPEYLTALRGIIDSPDIPLNVSRSALQMDSTVRMLSTHISKKVSDSLNQLYKEDKETFIRHWEDMSPIVKIGAIQDEKFYERVKDILIFKNVKGDILTIEEYRAKHSGKIYYTKDAAQPLVQLYTQKGIDVLVFDPFYDPYLISTIESKNKDLKFQRIDGGLDDQFVDQANDEQKEIAAFFQTHLQDISVEAKNLNGVSIPGFVQLKEEERRLRDYMRNTHPSAPFANLIKPTFVINTANPLIGSIYKMGSKNPDLSQELVRQVYELSLLGQKEMEGTHISSFIERSQKVLSKLLESETL